MGRGAWTSTKTQGLKIPTREAVCRDPLLRKCSADWAVGIGEQGQRGEGGDSGGQAVSSYEQDPGCSGEPCIYFCPMTELVAVRWMQEGFQGSEGRACGLTCVQLSALQLRRQLSERQERSKPMGGEAGNRTGVLSQAPVFTFRILKAGGEQESQHF